MKSGVGKGNEEAVKAAADMSQASDGWFIVVPVARAGDGGLVFDEDADGSEVQDWEEKLIGELKDERVRWKVDVEGGASCGCCVSRPSIV